jgi:hypothetical protein
MSQFLRIEVRQETRVVGALSTPAPSNEYVANPDKDDSPSSPNAGVSASPFL